MAASANRLLDLLGLPLTRADFVANIDGNTAAADSLIGRITDSKDPEVAELSRRLAGVTSSDGITYEDITDHLADELYGPRGKQSPKPAAEPQPRTGIQGQDKAAKPEVVERVEGVDSSQQALGTTPANADPKAEEGGPKASPAAVKAAQQFGVDLKNVKPTGKGGTITQKDVLLARKDSGEDPAAGGEAPDKPAAAPAADAAGEVVDDANDDAAGTHPFGDNFVTAGSGMNPRTFATPPMANFQTDTLQPTRASDPMQIGIRDLLLNRNASSGVDAVGAFMPGGSSTDMPATGMPDVPPPPPPPKYNPFLMGGQTPTKPSPPTDPLAGLLANDFDYVPEMDASQAPPPAPGLQPNDFDYVPDMGASPAAAPGLSPNDIDYVFDMPPPPAPGLSPSDIDYIPQPEPGGSSPRPQDSAEGPWQPTNSMAANFFKSMGLPGGERFLTVGTAPIDSSLDFMANHPKLTAAGLVGAGLGLTRLNQSPPNPNAVSQEQADKDALELRAARQRLAEQSRRGAPAVIPER